MSKNKETIQEELKHRSLPSKKYLQFMDREWQDLRAILGNDWAMFYYLLGGRGVGKSYSVLRFFVHQWKTKGRPFVWLRISEASMQKLLTNNAEKLVDPDIRRFYNLDLMTKGNNVYEVKRDKKGKVIEKKLMARVFALSTFYNDKGSGLYDADFLKDPKMYYNICLDEMNRDKNEKKTHDILYSFANQLENLIRKEKSRVRIICIGNTIEEASDLLVGLNFIPEEFGRYKLKKKRTVIDYIPLTDKQREKNEGTAGNILMPEASTFTNELKVDISHIYKGKLTKPTQIIKFSKDKNDWFTVWDSRVINQYNGEKISNSVWMTPWGDSFFVAKLRDDIIVRYQVQAFLFRNLMTQKKFKKYIQMIKPNGK